MTKVRIFDGQAKIKPLDQSNNEKNPTRLLLF